MTLFRILQKTNYVHIGHTWLSWGKGTMKRWFTRVYWTQWIYLVSNHGIKTHRSIQRRKKVMCTKKKKSYKKMFKAQIAKTEKEAIPTNL